jgi:hypothetical protein
MQQCGTMEREKKQEFPRVITNVMKSPLQGTED